MSTVEDILKDMSMGQRIAEEEQHDLSQYFVKTDQWRRLYNGGVDIVYGPKGSGKSALYSLLLANNETLAGRSIFVIPAENIHGEPVFQGLVDDPPTSEHEFVYLWKTYFLSLVGGYLKGVTAKSRRLAGLVEELEAADLIVPGENLKTKLRAAIDFVRSRMSKPGVELEATVDVNTGAPVVKGRVILGEPSLAERKSGVVSVDDLLQEAHLALKEIGQTVWVALDRLDVAFAQSQGLEKNALRALFRVYLDMRNYDRLSLKIFLRSDIWSRITADGFREASHITRAVTIDWDNESLLNLVVRRLLHNQGVCDYLKCDREQVMADSDLQDGVFYKVYPRQVDSGDRRSTTFKWMLSRVSDGMKKPAPRELIHLLSVAREQQLKLLEIGESEPAHGVLFSAAAIKKSLPEVSRTRLEQTIYAEYSELKIYIEELKGQKTEQRPSTLAEIWAIDPEQSREIAESLVEIGFFEKQGSKESPTYWVPFLYRPALDMVQGKAWA